MQKEKLYIAYGSNLNLGQMKYRCPTAKVAGTSEIKDYKLLFRGSKTLIFCVVFFGLSLIVHLIYRTNTKKYTQSWLDFKVSQVNGQLEYQRIDAYYYLMVGLNLILALLASQLLGS